jgi:hypothetical protein
VSEEDKKFYNGTSSLEALSEAVAMFGDSRKPTRRISKEQKYHNLREWMLPYFKRYLAEGELGKGIEKEEKSIFPTEQELIHDMGLTYAEFENIIQDFGDAAMLTSSPEDISEFGIKKGVNYVMIQSIYPDIYEIVAKKEHQSAET